MRLTLRDGKQRIMYAIKENDRIEIQVDGEVQDIIENSNLVILLREAVRLRQDVIEWGSAYEKLESIARDYIDSDILEEQLER